MTLRRVDYERALAWARNDRINRGRLTDEMEGALLEVGWADTRPASPEEALAEALLEVLASGGSG